MRPGPRFGSPPAQRPSALQKVTTEYVRTHDEQNRLWIETRRNRLTGELENKIRGGYGKPPSDSALRLHLGTLEAKWAYRKSEADFLLELLRRRP